MLESDEIQYPESRFEGPRRFLFRRTNDAAGSRYNRHGKFSHEFSFGEQARPYDSFVCVSNGQNFHTRLSNQTNRHRFNANPPTATPGGKSGGKDGNRRPAPGSSTKGYRSYHQRRVPLPSYVQRRRRRGDSTRRRRHLRDIKRRHRLSVLNDHFSEYHLDPRRARINVSVDQWCRENGFCVDLPTNPIPTPNWDRRCVSRFGQATNSLDSRDFREYAFAAVTVDDDEEPVEISEDVAPPQSETATNDDLESAAIDPTIVSPVSPDDRDSTTTASPSVIRQIFSTVTSSARRSPLFRSLSPIREVDNASTITEDQDENSTVTHDDVEDSTDDPSVISATTAQRRDEASSLDDHDDTLRLQAQLEDLNVERILDGLDWLGPRASIENIRKAKKIIDDIDGRIADIIVRAERDPNKISIMALIDEIRPKIARFQSTYGIQVEMSADVLNFLQDIDISGQNESQTDSTQADDGSTSSSSTSAATRVASNSHHSTSIPSSSKQAYNLFRTAKNINNPMRHRQRRRRLHCFHASTPSDAGPSHPLTTLVRSGPTTRPITFVSAMSLFPKLSCGRTFLPRMPMVLVAMAGTTVVASLLTMVTSPSATGNE